MSNKQPTVLIIGATGQTGRLIMEEFSREPGNVQLRLTARKQADVERLRSAGNERVRLDLDDPTTFGPALAGVDRLYLLSGYTVAMLHQSKTLVDAAKKARVRHIVHQGMFGEWDCTDPHFAWRPDRNLHQGERHRLDAPAPEPFHGKPDRDHADQRGDVPHVLRRPPDRVGGVEGPGGSRGSSLRDGPERHGGQDYWLSTEVLSGPEAATILTEVVGEEVRCDVKGPDDFKAFFTSSKIPSSDGMPRAWSSSCGR